MGREKGGGEEGLRRQRREATEEGTSEDVTRRVHTLATRRERHENHKERGTSEGKRRERGTLLYLLALVGPGHGFNALPPTLERMFAIVIMTFP